MDGRWQLSWLDPKGSLNFELLCCLKPLEVARPLAVQSAASRPDLIPWPSRQPEEIADNPLATRRSKQAEGEQTGSRATLGNPLVGSLEPVAKKPRDRKYACRRTKNAEPQPTRTQRGAMAQKTHWIRTTEPFKVPPKKAWQWQGDPKRKLLKCRRKLTSLDGAASVAFGLKSEKNSKAGPT